MLMDRYDVMQQDRGVQVAFQDWRHELISVLAGRSTNRPIPDHIEMKYGLRWAQSFSHIMKNMGIRLYPDLHAGNYCIRKNGSLVLTDPFVFAQDENSESTLRALRVFTKMEEI